MKYFDFNIHLPCGKSELDDRLNDEADMTCQQFLDCFYKYKDELLGNYFGGNIMLLNASLSLNDYEVLYSDITSRWNKSCLTVMVDPRQKNWKEHIRGLSDIGVIAIKFHCYIQKITAEDINQCVEIAKNAEALGMMVALDTSYGSLGLYKYDNLLLASAIASSVKKAPIILLHSGGARCMEAMLLAEASDNIYLETSFSLPYYLGSSVEQDLAYIYKKLGENKIVYGSDFPYISQEQSKESFSNFMDKWKFSATQIEMISKYNALRLTGLNV